MNLSKKPLTVAFSLVCLKIRSRNEEVINSTQNETDLLAKCFLLPILSMSILSTHVSNDRKYICGRRL